MSLKKDLSSDPRARAGLQPPCFLLLGCWVGYYQSGTDNPPPAPWHAPISHFTTRKSGVIGAKALPLSNMMQSVAAIAAVAAHCRIQISCFMALGPLDARDLL